MINWKLERVAIRELKNHPKNPRQINKESLQRLTKLIDKFGLIDKPIINADRTIIGGHQRIKILKKMKVKEIECQIPDRMLDEKEVEELLIGHNLIQGNWDWDIMANNFEPLDLLKYGFTEQQLFGYFEEAENIQGEKEEKSEEKKLRECPNCGHSF